MNGPDISMRIKTGTKSEFMIIATDAPVIRNGLISVSPAITIDILHSRHFRALSRIKPAVVECDSQRLVKILGE